MKLEVEQKFRIDDPAEMRKRLAALGAVEQGSIRQVDGYYAHPNRDFAATDEALRIRLSGDQSFITYKGPKLDSTTKTRHEIDLPLGGGQAAADGFAQLLLALGFRPVGEVKKSRTTSLIPRGEWHIEAAIDEVDGIGTFIELELVVDVADLDRARAEVGALAELLDLKAGERRSYLELLLK